jgi:hypothetical protein
MDDGFEAPRPALWCRRQNRLILNAPDGESRSKADKYVRDQVPGNA